MVTAVRMVGSLLPVLLSVSVFAQRDGPPATGENGKKKAVPVYTVKMYDPKRDAAQDLAATIKRARADRKRIILEIGGKW